MHALWVLPNIEWNDSPHSLTHAQAHTHTHNLSPFWVKWQLKLSQLLTSASQHTPTHAHIFSLYPFSEMIALTLTLTHTRTLSPLSAMIDVCSFLLYSRRCREISAEKVWAVLRNELLISYKWFAFTLDYLELKVKPFLCLAARKANHKRHRQN